MRVFNIQNQTSVLLNTSINGPYVPLKSIFMYCIASTITGTPTGTLKLQASNDPETNDTQYNVTNGRPPSVAPTHWVDITDSTFTVTTAGTTMWNVREIGYNYVRVVYTDTSSGASTATMTTVFNGKGA